MASESRNLGAEAEGLCVIARQCYARGYAAIVAAISAALHEAIFSDE